MNRILTTLVTFVASSALAGPALIYIEPDTQTLSSAWNGNQGGPLWTGAHAALCAHSPKIKALLHVGDLVDVPSDSQYAEADRAFATKLDGCGIDVHAAVGNHDFDTHWSKPLTGLTRWRNWRSRRATLPAQQDVGPETFLSPLVGNWWIASLPVLWAAPRAAWLGAAIDALAPGQYVIFLNHWCVKASGFVTTSSSCVAFVDAHPKILAAVAGHWLEMKRDNFTQTTLPSGRSVISIYLNYQHMKPSPVERWGGLITLDWEGGSLTVSPYDPVTGATAFPGGTHKAYNGGFIAASSPPATFAIPPDIQAPPAAP